MIKPVRYGSLHSVAADPEQMGIRSIRKYAWFLWALLAYDMLARQLTPGYEELLSAAHALALIVASIWTAVRMWREEPATALSPLWYVLLATSAFYGVGVLFYNFANSASLDWVGRHYEASGPELLMVNQLMSAGLATMWTAALVVLPHSLRVPIVLRKSAGFSPRWLARYFFIAGFGILYGLIVPYMLGLTPFILPGFVMLSVSIAFSSIFLMAVCFHRSLGRDFRILLPVGICGGILAGLIVTSKTWVLLSLVFYFIGSYYVHRKWRRLIGGALVLLVVYAAVTPFTQFVRNESAQQGDWRASQTVGVWRDYLGPEGSSVNDDTQWWFLRLSYVSAQAYAMSQFDGGTPGDTVAGGLEDLLLPRIFFPEKPVRQMGRDFSAGYGGNDQNSISPGIFAEAYWNGGWLAVVLAGVAAGVLIGFAHRVVVQSLKMQNWILLPFCIGLFLAMGQINGFFIGVLVYQPIVLLGLQAVIYAAAAVFVGGARFEGMSRRRRVTPRGAVDGAF